jgi:hypothetical protein
MNILKIPASIQTSMGIKLSICILLAIPDIDEMDLKGKA